MLSEDIKNQIGSIEAMQAMVNAAVRAENITEEASGAIKRRQASIGDMRKELGIMLETFKKQRESLEGGVTIDKNIVKSVLFQEFNGFNVVKLRKLGTYRVFFLLNIVGDPNTYLGSFDRNNKLVAFTKKDNPLPLLGEWKRNQGMTMDLLRIGGAFLDVTVEEKTSYKDEEGKEVYAAKSMVEILATWVKNGRDAVGAQKMTAKLFKENKL